MIRIAITPVAAVGATLALGSVGFERAVNAKASAWFWLEAAVVDP
jgi:hypothetical protein